MSGNSEVEQIKSVWVLKAAETTLVLTLAGKGTAKPLGRLFLTISDASGFNWDIM